MKMTEILLKEITSEEKKQAYLDLYQATDNEDIKQVIQEKIEALESDDTDA